MNTTTRSPRPPRALPDLQRELTRTHRARITRRSAIATGAVALPAIALVLALLPHPGSATLRVASSPAPSLEGEGLPKAGERGTSLASTQKTGEDSSPVIIESMTDEELLAALAEAGQPSGLITINGHTTVVANRFPDGPSPFAPFGTSINAAP